MEKAKSSQKKEEKGEALLTPLPGQLHQDNRAPLNYSYNDDMKGGDQLNYVPEHN